MKHICSALLIIPLALASCQPSNAAIQTATGQTQAASAAVTVFPTLTKVPSTATASPTADDCPMQSALDWLNQADPVFSQFLVDGNKAVAMLADVNAPIDVVEMTSIYQSNLARERALTSIKAPPCLQDVHGKMRAAFSDYSAMYKAMSENDLERALSDFYKAKKEWEEAFQLLENFSKQHNIPLQ